MVYIYEPVTQFDEIAKRRYNLELEGVKTIKKHLSMKANASKVATKYKASYIAITEKKEKH